MTTQGSCNWYAQTLINASKHAAPDVQKQYIINLVDNFRIGDSETYRESLKLWLRDNRPAVETIFRFVEPYRDPAGLRAEFEGLSAIVDKEKTEQLVAVSRNASKIVRRLPWCGLNEENDGKGPFEKEMFNEADLTSIYTIAYCSSIIFPRIILPNYNDIRQSTGSKSVMFAKSMMHDVPASDADCIQPSEKQTYLKHKPHAFYLWVVFHELLGHGTGKLEAEDSSGKFNFDHKTPPFDPIAQKPIRTWYKPG